MTTSALARSVVATAAVTALLGSTTALAASGRAAGAMAGAPELGACTTLTSAQAAAPNDESTVVPCGQPHTAYVAAVVRLPAALDWDTATKKDLRRVVAGRCAPNVLEALGPASWARADRTAYDYVFFQPTTDQVTAGARWLSCSIVLRQGAKLAALPRRHAPFVRGATLGDAIARCLTGGILRTTCGTAHAWRATGTFAVKAATRPSATSLDKTAARRCVPLVDPHKRYFRFTYPDPITWAGAGDHVVVCYSKTHQ
ncbi:MAG TPA: septum formation family protein [Nocardioides sp.]|jgi:hypothetical protein|uniref:septum formation family protein n=1 Tax=Nocardioides sp. TaxID=35761 RepID=UPI002E33E38F|nr:septum formation family protein [Nocardioides sp.]HEX3932044.1 septum formation family protein [Nocardioides sp.]